ncbi:MAG: hypothetical protein K6F39_00950 [Lachnospiraceae bacterium]|nr:hypothetical protein [Lachnospiraceae bacterium]
MRIWSYKEPSAVCSTVLAMIGCKKTDPSYDEFVRTFAEVRDEALETLDIKAGAIRAAIPADFPKSGILYGKDLIFFMITAGRRISDLAEKYMDEGEYIKGMIISGIADECLFSCEKEAFKDIEKYARINNIGIEGIFDAPKDYSLSLHKLISFRLKARENLGITLTEGDMLEPVKSYACALVLTKDTEKMVIHHSCNNCTLKECAYRNGT